jgi:hypothetical protein
VGIQGIASTCLYSGTADDQAGCHSSWGHVDTNKPDRNFAHVSSLDPNLNSRAAIFWLERVSGADHA